MQVYTWYLLRTYVTTSQPLPPRRRCSSPTVPASVCVYLRTYVTTSQPLPPRPSFFVADGACFLHCSAQGLVVRFAGPRPPISPRDTVASRSSYIRILPASSRDRPGFVRRCLLSFVLRARLRYCCCLLYTSPSPRDKRQSRMPSSA